MIAIEGIDGSGKTTQARKLHERLRGEGIASQIFHPFDDLGLGSEIRELLKKYEASPQIAGLLMAFVHARVKDAVGAQTDVVIMDRSTPSFFAYQKNFFRSPDGQVMRKLFDPLLGHPERVYLLDIDPEIAASRLEQRESSTIDNFNTLTAQKLIRDEYKNQAAESPDRFTVLDATNTPSEVHEQIYQAVINELR